jgi:hypothetical protein
MNDFAALLNQCRAGLTVALKHGDHYQICDGERVIVTTSRPARSRPSARSRHPHRGRRSVEMSKPYAQNGDVATGGRTDGSALSVCSCLMRPIRSSARPSCAHRQSALICVPARMLAEQAIAVANGGNAHSSTRSSDVAILARDRTVCGM